MSVDKFKFVSPGVFVNEIDNSQKPDIAGAMGPLIIGRARRGPAMRPVRVSSMSEFVEIFGNPVPGGVGGDLWRNGNLAGPTYGAYAAQAWLQNNSPVTYIRLLGDQHAQATTDGEAGWNFDKSPKTDVSLNGGAYGLFVLESGSWHLGDRSTATLAGMNAVTGTLGAIFYVKDGAVRLSGSLVATDAATTASIDAFVESDASGHFKVEVLGTTGAVTEAATISFSRNNENFIRRALNTNPTRCNSTVSSADGLKTYWVGETFEKSVEDLVSTTKKIGFITCLQEEDSAVVGSDFTFGSQRAQTGWYFAQNLGAAAQYDARNMQKLFYLEALESGEWEQSNLKVSIGRVKAPNNPSANPYGSFDVVIRNIRDTDATPMAVERFSNCNLNPYSPNYLAKKIGDKHITWSDTERRYREYGNHPNISKYIRVRMSGDVDRGLTDPELLPFGVYGPTRFQSFGIVSGSEGFNVTDIENVNSGGAGDTQTTTELANRFVKANAGPSSPGHIGAYDYILAPSLTHESDWGIPTSNTQLTATIHFPALTLRASSDDSALGDPSDAYFGVDTRERNGSNIFDRGVVDLVRAHPGNVGKSGAVSLSTDPVTKYSYIFTLDDLVGASGSLENAVYTSGSCQAGTSWTAISGTYRQILDEGFDSYTTVLAGGFDGLDVLEKEPFGNHVLDENQGELTNSAYYSVKKAINAAADPEVVEYNLITMPGIRLPALTDHLMNTAAARADALAIIDLESDGGYIPDTESNAAASARGGSVTTTVTKLRNRAINTSYACTFFPWVQIRDTIEGGLIWVPPSVVALGAMSFSENRSELWFAPAGFTRGGLSRGAAGIPVVAVNQHLTSKERDKLYDVNINPIASFPAEGIVIFGQKTLQVTASALDRINVRRMLIYVKKTVSRMAATILFDQNVDATWARFIGRVNPFLASVKSRLGLSDFKVILDRTTTTPDLIDRNIMYAKVFLKPTKAIEFIALDFTVTDQGASFAD